MKIPCGGFYINDSDFNISEEGELSLKNSGFSGNVFTVQIETDLGGIRVLSATYNELKNAYDANNLIILKDEETNIYSMTVLSSLSIVENMKYMASFEDGSNWVSLNPDEPMSYELA